MIGASCAVADEVARGQAWALRPNYLVARGKGAGGLMHRLLLVTAVLLAAAALSPAEAAERAAALRGLAAKYPGDRGLGSDSAVLAFSDYEDSEWKRGWDCSDWDCYHLTDDPSLAFAGAHSLEKTGPMGSEGATLSLDLKEPVEVLHHRVYARFKEGAANTRFFGISGVAAGLPQWKALGSAGVRPTELPYFCATLVTEEDHPRKPMWYPYHIDQKGPWGDNWPIDVEFPADRWFCLEMMVKMNTPGKPDGELRLWLDGRPVYAKADMRWRNDVSVRIGRAFDMVYRSTPFPNTSTYWVDNRVIATQYVGPMAGTAQATDAADPASGSRQMPDQTQESSGITLFVDPGRRSAADREQHMQYGLSATAPWAGGGSVFINFPEHLEYDTQGLSILRHWDGWENGPIPWVISPDAKQASYTVESPHEKGVMVESSARVATPDEVPPGTSGIHLSMRITNGSQRALPAIRPLLCVQYRGLTGFPSWTGNFEHSFIILDGKLVSLANLRTADPKASFKGCVVKGSPQRDTRAEQQGGLIEQDMDSALSIVESLDATRKLVVWWTPGKSMISNANIPCIHADPYFGTLQPGESAAAEGLVLFAHGDMGPVVSFLRARDRSVQGLPETVLLPSSTRTGRR